MLGDPVRDVGGCRRRLCASAVDRGVDEELNTCSDGGIDEGFAPCLFDGDVACGLALDAVDAPDGVVGCSFGVFEYEVSVVEVAFDEFDV